LLNFFKKLKAILVTTLDKSNWNPHPVVAAVGAIKANNFSKYLLLAS
jgi:hypothetical protein